MPSPLPIVLPFLVAAALVLLLGNPTIALLAGRSARQPVSGDAPAAHQAKQGTPTMGGLLLVGAAFVATIIAALLYVPETDRRIRLLAVAGALLGGGIVGFLDDWGKARQKRNQAGLSERVKLALQIVVAALFMMAVGLTEQGDLTTSLALAGRSFDLGIAYYALGVLYLCGFGNAVNFTDGLDGLAAGITAIAAVALGVLAATGYVFGEMFYFYLAVAGACVGFLWFNAHPARVFMGDTGSLALGMGLSAAAIAAKQELLLFVVGIVYVLEILSMIVQRYVFKIRRIRHGIEYARAHRVFRRAPLHHHFEELGWPETRVVVRFCIVGLLAAALGILLAPNLSPFPGTGIR